MREGLGMGKEKSWLGWWVGGLVCGCFKFGEGGFGGDFETSQCCTLPPVLPACTCELRSEPSLWDGKSWVRIAD